MNIRIEKDNKILDVNLRLHTEVAMVLLTEEELTKRSINVETDMVTIDTNISFKVGDEEIMPIAKINDIVYSNTQLLIYVPSKHRFIIMPDITHLIGVFDLYSISVTGMVLGASERTRNDNVSSYSLTHGFPTDNTILGQTTLDITKLDKIKIKTHAINLPGNVKTNNLGNPTYYNKVNDWVIKNGHTYIALALEVEYGVDDEVLTNDVISASMLVGNDIKNIRGEHLKVSKDVSKKFKKIYVLE